MFIMDEADVSRVIADDHCMTVPTDCRPAASRTRACTARWRAC
jgi:hypothetical protein